MKEDIIIGLGIWSFASIIISIAIIGILIVIFFLVIWIITLIDCIRRKPDEFPPGTGGENAKTIWLAILIATFFITQLNGIAAIVYYFVVMKKMPLKS